MKIIISINTSWNIYNFRKGLIQKLLEEGHHVYAVAPMDEYSERLGELGCEFYGVDLQNTGGNPLHDLKYLWQLIQIYRKIRPDFVLHYTIKPNIYGAFACLLTGAKAINNISGLGTVFLHQNLTAKVALILYKLAFRIPKKLFFQNSDDRDLFIEKKLASPKKCQVIPGSGVDIQHFKPVPFQRNTPLKFLLIARLIIEKGIIEYAQAAKQLKHQGHDAVFQLAGDPAKGHNRAIPEVTLLDWQKNGTIDYLGTTDHINELINQADCIVLPSYREGMSKTLLEAAACGKPIVTTDVPGCRHIADHGKNGFLCKAKDAQDLALQLEKIIHSSDESLQEMGVQSRKKAVREFDEKIVIETYLKTMQKLILA